MRACKSNNLPQAVFLKVLLYILVDTGIIFYNFSISKFQAGMIHWTFIWIKHAEKTILKFQISSQDSEKIKH